MLWRLGVALTTGTMGVFVVAFVMWVDHTLNCKAPCCRSSHPPDDPVWQQEDDPIWETRYHDV